MRHLEFCSCIIVVIKNKSGEFPITCLSLFIRCFWREGLARFETLASDTREKNLLAISRV